MKGHNNKHGLPIAGVAMSCLLSIASLALVPQGRAGTFPPVTGLAGTPEDDTLDITTPVDATISETTDLAETLGVRATGIDALSGDDTVTTGGTGTVNADAEATAEVDIALDRTETQAAATGIFTSAGVDTVTTAVPLTVTADAMTDTSLAFFSILEPGLAPLGAGATADATGVAGGPGIDSLTLSQDVTVMTTADNALLDLTLTAVALPVDVFGVGEARIDADATAIGVSANATAAGCDLPFEDCGGSAGAGIEMQANSGALSVLATATAHADNVSMELLGRERGDTSRDARASATGMGGSAGQDQITNTGTLNVDAIATSSIDSVDVMFSGLLPFPVPTPPNFLLELFGAPLGESATVAEARAVGLHGGSGDDTLVNNGPAGGGELVEAEDCATSTAEVCAQATATSDTARLTIPIPKPAAPAPAAAGITTTAGAATPTEDVPVADTAIRALTLATGIAGGEGNDTLTNSAPFAVESFANANSSSLAFGIAKAAGNFPVTLNIPMASGETAAQAVTLGVDSGGGVDRIDNTDGLAAYAHAGATADSFTLDIQAGETGIAFGVGLADGSTVASALATGIAGGGAIDYLTNSGHLDAQAHSNVSTTSITIGLSGVAEGLAAAGSLALADSNARADSVGIDGGLHDAGQGVTGDTIGNTGIVDSRAEATGTSNSVSVTATYAGTGVVVGVSLADADTKAGAHADGIRTGAGEDTITSEGDESVVDATAIATANSNSVAVTVAGTPEGISLAASAARATTEAIATTDGVAAGAGNDTITNRAGLVSDATATANTTSVSVTAQIAPFSLGAALAEAGALADAGAVGIGGGDGMDEINNYDLIDVDASATTDVDTVTLNFSLAGAALADVSSRAFTQATGLDGGAGMDTLMNFGGIEVDAISTIDANASSANLIGHAQGDLTQQASAIVTGIDAGDREAGATVKNTIGNAEPATIIVAALAKTDADNYVIEGGGLAEVSTGGTTTAAATGIAGGLGVDSVVNSGLLEVSADAVNSLIGFGFTGAGVQTVRTNISADATAIGIEVSEGDNITTNAGTGSMHVHAGVDNLAGAVSAGILTFEVADSSAGATAAVHGIRSGAGIDTVTNAGTLDVTASLFNDAGSGAIGLFAISDADALTDAALTGIDAGGGDDVVDNTGTLTVGKVVSPPGGCLDISIACSRAASVAIDLVSLVKARLGATATLTGISGGEGNDTLTNTGTLTVGDSEEWMVIGETDSFAGSFVGFLESAEAYGNASVNSTGMHGGAGDDNGIFNEGTLNVTASAYADVYAESDVGVIGFLLSLALSNADSDATATGMIGGQGEDILGNSGAMRVDAHALTRVRSVGSVGLLERVVAEATATATATAIGIDTGAGSGMATNTGTLAVEAFSETRTTTEASTGSGGEAFSDDNNALLAATALGMRGQAGDDTLDNGGGMTVTARTGGRGVNSLDVFSEDHVEAGPVLPANDDGVPGVGNPGVQMHAVATGIDSGAGQDAITNTGTLEVNARANAWGEATNDSNERHTTADLSILAQATATGLTAAGEISNFTHTGLLAVTAEAAGFSFVDSCSLFENADGDAWMKAEAVAYGVHSLPGFTTIDSGGTIDVSAYAEPAARANADAGLGDSGIARASALGVARATGFAVGDAGSVITGNSAMTVTATVDYDAGSAVSTADDRATSAAEAEAYAVGIDAGAGYNEITNLNALVVEADVRSMTLALFNSVNSSAAATATAAGIRAGVREGNETGNLIMNSSGITVRARADAIRQSFSFPNFTTIAGSQSAAAVGIETGGGADIIHHSGSMFTEAETLAFSFGGAVTAATGISTGAGADIIYQTGSIVTREFENAGLFGKDSAGTAINTGAGNDTVFLSGDSSTDGLVRLDEGDDLLVLADTAQVLWTEDSVTGPGFIFGGDGIDTLRIDDRNSFTLAAADSTERLEIGQGQLVIDGDHAMIADSLLEVEIYEDDSGETGSGQLVVNGNATLDGVLTVDAPPGFQRSNETYDVVTAGWIDPASDFSEVNLPDSALVRFLLVDPRPLNQVVRVETTVYPFITTARYPLQRTIAQYLDGIAPAASGELESLLAAFQQTPAAGMDAAFASFSPDGHEATTAVAVMNGLDVMRSLQRRMLMRRAPVMQAGFGGLGSDPWLLAYNGNGAGSPGLFGAPAAGPASGRFLSLDGFLVSGDRDPGQGYTGFDYTTRSIALTPQLVRDKFLAGASVGITDTDIDFSDGRGDGDIRAWHAGVFGSVYTDRAYVEAGLAYSEQEYDNDRNILVGGSVATAESEHDGDVLMGFAGAGYTFEQDEWALQPYASLYYTAVDEDGFTETGAGAANLAVAGRATESLVGETGVRMSRPLDVRSGDLDLDLAIGVNHDFDIENRNVTATLPAGPGSAFTIDGRDVEETSAVFGTGIIFRRRGMTASLQYRGQFNADYDSHAVFARLGIEF